MAQDAMMQVRLGGASRVSPVETARPARPVLFGWPASRAPRV